MAITPIPNIYHGFTFAGEYSADYGVYIQEPAVFDAPERDVEMITIPGRDGELAFDKGRFRNIEVTYHCTLPAKSEGDFITGVANFRNMLASKVGYQRLEDDINTTEYRQAAFISGLAVNTVNIESGTFDVVFNCKPQRFLTSGETAVELQSGDTITNPTLFESRPMLEVDGYGGIAIDGSLLQVNSVPMGIIDINYTRSVVYADLPSNGIKSSYAITFDDTLLNNNDRVWIDALSAVCRFDSSYAVSGVVADHPDIWQTDIYINDMVTASTTLDISFSYSQYESDSIGPETITITASSGGTTYTGAMTTTVNWTYAGADTLTIDVYQFTNSVAWASNHGAGYINPFTIKGKSSKSALGSPLYFDLDIGEAYKIEGGVPVSVNNAVTIPAVLPTLKPGSNTITFDNTITQFQIVPRWWTV